MCECCAESAERCSYCGWEIDDNGECNCPPEGYLKPGTETIMYVNAYAVTRHYGGPEEGGWWYNRQTPLASIPVKAIVMEGHTDTCYQCDRARREVIEPDGQVAKMCKWGYHVVPKDMDQVQDFKQHLMDIYYEVKEGNIYSVLGGTDVRVCLEENPAEEEPKGRPQYE